MHGQRLAISHQTRALRLVEVPLDLEMTTDHDRRRSPGRAQPHPHVDASAQPLRAAYILIVMASHAPSAASRISGGSAPVSVPPACPRARRSGGGARQSARRRPVRPRCALHDHGSHGGAYVASPNPSAHLSGRSDCSRISGNRRKLSASGLTASSTTDCGLRRYAGRSPRSWKKGRSTCTASAGSAGLVERAVHQLHPAIARRFVEAKRGVTHPQPRVAALLHVGRRPAEAADEEQTKPLLRARQVGRGIHRPRGCSSPGTCA